MATLNKKITIPHTDVTDDMKVEWLKYFVEHGKPNPSYHYVWIETPRLYYRFGDIMSRYLKYKDGRAKNGLTISVAGQKWLDGKLRSEQS